MGVRFFHSGFPWLVAVVLGGRLALGASDIAADHVTHAAPAPVVMPDEARLAPAPPPASPPAPRLAKTHVATPALAPRSASAPRSPRSDLRDAGTAEPSVAAAQTPEHAPAVSPAPARAELDLRPGSNPFLRYDALTQPSRRQGASAAQDAARIELPRERPRSADGPPGTPVSPLLASLPASVQGLAAMAGAGGLRVDLPTGSREDPAVTGLAAQCSLWPVAVKVTGRFR